MLGTIGFERYSIRCIIGTEPHERRTEQEILVDVRVEADISTAVQYDELGDTVNYIELAELCKTIALEGKYFLVETYAAEVAQAIYDRFPVKSVYVCIRKPWVLEGAECAFVSVKIGA